MLNVVQAITEITSTANKADIPRLLVDAPFTFKFECVQMGLGIIVLLLLDEPSGLIHRVALSNTEMADGTKQYSDKRFEDIKIPLASNENIIAKAIRTGEPQSTSDWNYLFTPALTPEQARFNQTGGTIAMSHVYPLDYDGGKGAMIYSFFQPTSQSIVDPTAFMTDYSQLVGKTLTKSLADDLISQVS
jgi:hypothetical protein